MTFQELERQLLGLGVPSQAYSLGVTTSESYCLIETGGSYAVYYFNRGTRVDERTFPDIDSAGRYLLSLVERFAGQRW
jgi:hypothetical protein